MLPEFIILFVSYFMKGQLYFDLREIVTFFFHTGIYVSRALSFLFAIYLPENIK